MGRPRIFSCFRCLGDDDKKKGAINKGAKEPAAEPAPSKPQPPYGKEGVIETGAKEPAAEPEPSKPQPPCAGTTTEAAAVAAKGQPPGKPQPPAPCATGAGADADAAAGGQKEEEEATAAGADGGGGGAGQKEEAKAEKKPADSWLSGLRKPLYDQREVLARSRSARTDFDRRSSRLRGTCCPTRRPDQRGLHGW